MKIIFLFFLSVFITPSLFAEIIKTEFQNSFPKYYLQKGKMTGLCIDIIKAIELQDPSLHIFKTNSFKSFKRIQSNLEKGDIDLIFCFARNKEREEKFLFLDTPLYQVNHLLIARANDNIQIDNFKQLSQFKEGAILTVFGTSTARHLKSQSQATVDAGARTIRLNLKKLQYGRGRLFYFHDLGTVNTIKAFFNEDDFRVIRGNFKRYNHYIAFSKKVSQETVTKVDNALKAIQASGQLKQITQNYLPDSSIKQKRDK